MWWEKTRAPRSFKGSHWPLKPMWKVLHLRYPAWVKQSSRVILQWNNSWENDDKNQDLHRKSAHTASGPLALQQTCVSHTGFPTRPSRIYQLTLYPAHLNSFPFPVAGHTNIPISWCFLPLIAQAWHLMCIFTQISSQNIQNPIKLPVSEAYADRLAHKSHLLLRSLCTAAQRVTPGQNPRDLPAGPDLTSGIPVLTRCQAAWVSPSSNVFIPSLPHWSIINTGKTQHNKHCFFFLPYHLV